MALIDYEIIEAIKHVSVEYSEQLKALDQLIEQCHDENVESRLAIDNHSPLQRMLVNEST